MFLINLLADVIFNQPFNLKIMKKIIVLSLLFASLFAQELCSQSLYFGLKGGLNFANMLEQSDAVTFSEEYKYLQGYNIGLLVETDMSDGIIGESGIYLITKGFRLEGGDDINGASGTFSTLWVDIPFKVKTKKAVGQIEFFASGGVSGGLGLSGKMEMDLTLNGNTTSLSEDIKWGDDPDEDDLVRIDYGAIGSIGAEFKSIIIEASYYYGLANLSSYTDDGYVISSRYFAISLGYKFGL